jgi:hypothetical protein
MGMRVRIVMEFLGLVEPDRTRREPVAVPGWAPYAAAGTVATAGGLIAWLARLGLRAFTS